MSVTADQDLNTGKTFSAFHVVTLARRLCVCGKLGKDPAGAGDPNWAQKGYHMTSCSVYRFGGRRRKSGHW